MFTQVHMPSLGGATEWLNSEPLGRAELRGHVVLVNFWTPGDFARSAVLSERVHRLVLRHFR